MLTRVWQMVQSDKAFTPKVKEYTFNDGNKSYIICCGKNERPIAENYDVAMGIVEQFGMVEVTV